LALGLLALDVLVGLELPALQHVLRRPEEVLEELALPCIPYLRAGAADIGDRKQIQRDQPPLGLDDVSETPDHLGVGQVLLLRDRRHGEMVLDKEYNQIRVLGRRGRAPDRKRRASTLPSCEWSPPRPLAMSWKIAAM